VILPVVVSAESVVLVVIALLVLGLLRSHAETLRWQREHDEREGEGEGLREHQAELREQQAELREDPLRRAPGIEGVDLRLQPTVLEFDGLTQPVLLAFLTSGCFACRHFWDVLQQSPHPPDVPGGARVIVVAKDRRDDSLSGLRKLASGNTRVVLSSEAWVTFRARTSPYFVYVAPGGAILGSGVSETWDQLHDRLENVLGDIEIESELASVDRDGNSVVVW
jgi:hypothetical protein